MKISEYVREYTSGRPIRFGRIFVEFFELIQEIFKFDKKGIREEFGDTLHFIQLWLFWRFKIDGELWKITQDSTDKFMKRREVWRKIYRYIGLPENISNYVGNYNREEKVIAQLKKFGVDENRAKEAYKKLVVGLIYHK